MFITIVHRSKHFIIPEQVQVYKILPGVKIAVNLLIKPIVEEIVTEIVSSCNQSKLTST